MHASHITARGGVAGDIATLGAATMGLGAGAVTVVAASCCTSPVLAPIIVGVLGASGAVWAANLKPYGWWIIAVAAAALALGYWFMYRSRPACVDASAPNAGWRPILAQLARISLWIGTVTWAAAFLLKLVLPQ